MTLFAQNSVSFPSIKKLISFVEINSFILTEIDHMVKDEVLKSPDKALKWRTKPNSWLMRRNDLLKTQNGKSRQLMKKS